MNVCQRSAAQFQPGSRNSVVPRPPGRDSGAGRAILTRRLVTIPDVIEGNQAARRPATD